MAAYQTQQINIGNIQAPDVGQITGRLVDRINKQQSNELDMMNQIRQNEMQAQRFAREQELNKRADIDWNRQQSARKEIANVTKDYINAPYASKYGADVETAALDKRIQSLPQSVWENLTPEQATALQEKYENVGQNKEAARTKLIGTLMANGNVDYTSANAVAEDLTKGLMSRADKQAALEAQYKAQLDANKAYNEYVSNVNKDTTDIYKAKLDYQKAFGPNGTGGGTAGGVGPSLKEFNAGTTMDDVYKYIEDKSLGGLDSSGGRSKVRDLYNDGKGLHPAVILQALQNNTITGGGLLSDSYINQEGLDQALVGKKLGQEGLNELVMRLRNRQPMNLADPTRAEYVDPRSITRQIYNSTPNADRFLAEALKDDKLAFLRTPEEQDKIAKAIAPNTPTNSTAGDKKYAGDKMPDGLSYNEKVTWLENRKAIANGGLEAAYKTEGGKDKGWGRYQMMGSTLDGYRNNKEFMVDGKPFTNEQFRNNPELQDKVFTKYSADNEASLVRQGIPVNDWTKWLAHNLGAGSVKNFLNRNETAQLKDYMKRQSGSPDSIDAYIDRFSSGFKLDDITTVVPRDSRFLPTDDTAIPPGNSDAIKSILDKSTATHKGVFTEKSEDIKAQLEALNKKGLVTEEDFNKAAELNGKFATAKANEQAATTPIYQKTLPEIFGFNTDRIKTRPEAYVPEANAAEPEPGLEDTSFDLVGFGRMAGSPIRDLAAARRFDTVLDINSTRLADIAKRKDELMKKYKHSKYESKVADEAAIEQKIANERSTIDDINTKYADDAAEEILAKAERTADAAKKAERDAAHAKAEQRAIEAKSRANRKSIEDEAPLRQAEREEILKVRNQPKPTEVQLEKLELRRMLNRGEIDETTYRYLISLF